MSYNLKQIRDELVNNHCEGILDETGSCKHCNIIIEFSKIIGDFP